MEAGEITYQDIKHFQPEKEAVEKKGRALTDATMTLANHIQTN